MRAADVAAQTQGLFLINHSVAAGLLYGNTDCGGEIVIPWSSDVCLDCLDEG